jgi:hypothetical protein
MKKRKIVLRLLIPLLLITGVVTWVSCNKGFDRVISQKNYQDTTSAVAQNPHVLYIVVDGARGQSVRDAQPPNIMGLTNNAIYCWNDVTDVSASKLTSWADLLTGVHQDKHQVLSGDISTSDLKDYPVFFSYIKKRDSSFRITAFSASDSIKQMLGSADMNETFSGDDEATSKAALNELNTDSSRLVFVEFSSVDQAGAKYGYDVSVPQYKSAILTVDGYIGELLGAIRKHKNYENEDWMVVITSNRGGSFQIPPEQDDHTILSDPSLNSFVIFYSPRYQTSFIDKPYTGNRYQGSSVELSGLDASAVNAIIPDDHGDYNFGDSIEFTIEMKVKVMPGPNGDYHYTYPSILAKRKSFDPGQPGWCIFLEQQFWQINFGQAGQGNTQVAGVNISDGTWHDIAVVVENRSGHRYARTYTDGNFNKEVDITGKGDINTDAPLTMGFLPGSVNTPADVNITGLKIWKAALDDATIGQFACETTLPGNHPYNDYLLGYWPCTDGQGGVFKDNGSLQHDFVLQGAYQWQSFNDLVCAPPSSNLSILMPQPVDIVRQILNWLQIAADPKWNLDGRVWTTNYVGINQ